MWKIRPRKDTDSAPRLFDVAVSRMVQWEASSVCRVSELFGMWVPSQWAARVEGAGSMGSDKS